MKLPRPLAALLCSCALLHADNEIGFIETFALAPDREAVLSQLLPGTEEFYFFHALHFQNSKQPAKLAAIMAQWAARFPDSAQRKIIENRAALLSYDADPQATLKFLRDRLGLQFNHVQETRDPKPDLPTTLDPARIAPKVFRAPALSDGRNLGEVSQATLGELVRSKTPLKREQKRLLLARLQRPDVLGLVELIADDLKWEESRGFGEFPIHKLLLPEQLAALLKLVPALAESEEFVLLRLRQLAPNADVDLEFDPVERDAWLTRAWDYAKTLPAAFPTVKATILRQRLEFDRTRGVYDKALFLEYLKLPRRLGYVNAKYLSPESGARAEVDLNRGFTEAALPLPAVGDDEPLVRDFFLHLFVTEDAWQPYAALVRDTWLKPVFAEAKIVNGIGRPEQWAPLLSPAESQALKDRVDLDFALTNPPLLAPADEVSLGLFVKNAAKVIVKVYEINTLSFFLSQPRPLNTDLQLDGLVANREETHAFEGSPLLRTARTFKFPELKGKRGAWVIEFIGGGKSSRALIRKGQWEVLQQSGAAGELLTVLDEQHQPVKDAVVCLDGRKFAPDEKTGFIVVPFTQQAGSKPIVLADAKGEFASLASLDHRAEQYSLDAEFHIAREQLLAGKEATVAVRTTLSLNNAVVSLALLTEPKLRITSTTLDGVSTTLEVPDLKLDPAKVFTHTFAVPERLASLSITLVGKVANLGEGGAREELEAADEWQVNGTDKAPVTNDGHLTQFGGNYVFELLGKNGEPVANRQIVFKFKHEDFTQFETIALRTDEQGRVTLGTLAGLEWLEAEFGPERTRRWPLRNAERQWPAELHAAAGEVVRLPWIADAATELPKVSLLEKRGEVFVRDARATLTVEDGFLEIIGLAPGDYSLVAHDWPDAVEIKITKGVPARNWLLSSARNLEVRNAAPVQIGGIKVEADALTVQIKNANPFTRVHVAAERFLPSETLFDQLGAFERIGPASGVAARNPNLFAAGRAIGDEYRYILERRYAHIFPGNMLARPGLLLNPWELRSTDLQAQTLARGRAAGATAGARGAMSTPAEDQKFGDMKVGEFMPTSSSNLDFLATAAPVLYNLVPDANGIVRIDRKALGDRQHVQIYAEDLSSAVWRSLALSEVPTRFRDLRLTRPLDPAKAFAEKKTASILLPGQTLTLENLLTSQLETYDSLARVYALLATLNADGNFAAFGWILQWPKLSPAEQRAKYSEFACHELNFFLSRKDPAFFAAVVQPYLRNKKEKTFMDEYLLGLDLRRHLEPWAFARLNAAERALLAQRIPGEAAATARHLRELWELLPPDFEREDLLFETALRGHGLELGASTRGVLMEAQEELSKSMPALAAGTKPASAPATILGRDSLVERETKIAGRSKNDADEPAAEALADAASAKKKESALGVDRFAYFGVAAGEEDVRLRQEVRQFYRQLGPTKEWAENNYYHVPRAQQDASLITINGFWRDYAAWNGEPPFLSANVAEVSRNFSEMLLALAVLDLPFEPAKHTTRTENGAFTFTAGSPAIIVHLQIQPALAAAPGEAEKAGASELLVSQNFHRQDDRYRQEGNEKFDKNVTEEFLTGVVYGANVVVTNPSSARQKLSLLLQIPQGALPVAGTKATDSKRLQMEPYTTQTFEYSFYFPTARAEAFAHYPVNAAVNGRAAGAAKPMLFHVVDQLTQFDKTSWDYLSQYGSEAEVFAFLEQSNIARLDLDRVAWRARQSVDFFRKLIAVLQQRHAYADTIYSYAIVHNEPGALREWLRHRDDFLAQCGPWFSSSLLTIDPIERRAYEHLEYSPLVNQRVHRIGAENKIANPVLRAQFQTFLRILAHKPALDAMDEMSLAYYLFLQDRTEEALAHFHSIKPETLPTRLQYDYFRCSAAFYEERLPEARGIAAQYADYPVDRWRKLFVEVTAQLDEIEGRKVVRPEGATPEPDRENQQAELAASEPSFDFKVEKQTIALTWHALREVTINYYLMDPELLFSASPFGTEDSARFAIIKPTRSVVQTLPAEQEALELPLPGEFAKANVLVEILGAGKRQAQAYHANTFKLDLLENYGRLELHDQAANKAVAKAYVKVYARLQNGTVRFFKDGYTDLRGKFDYASLNSSETPRDRPELAAGASDGAFNAEMLRPDEIPQVARLAILVLSATHGATVRECAPPNE